MFLVDGGLCENGFLRDTKVGEEEIEIALLGSSPMWFWSPSFEAPMVKTHMALDPIGFPETTIMECKFPYLLIDLQEPQIIAPSDL